ncbi:Putative BTB/POZ domain-containing protein [Septoria linicola]|uniref:BTB/POZ domain-containing protein n=1 Tax=Septoria linicola TaxID=215465 RepID=A0A9Q9AY67_9PEZI|nr:putative BTB/POZ domain-containing protein [Septoria linicola]USW53946.1 Putative BTB/POZ domain-containing protein [Septoria linicola]
MFSVSKRDKSYRDSFSHRAGKSMSSKRQKSFKEYGTSKRISTIQPVVQQPSAQSSPTRTASSPTSPNLNSAIVTIAIGPEQRLFAAHEDVLCRSPVFAEQIRKQFFESNGKRIDVPNEMPEVFSAILEYLYKGDYTPKLEYDKKHQSWFLDDGDAAKGLNESTVYINDNYTVLKDTVIYCSAHRYGLPDLQRLALKKQGLQSGVQCSTILSSARYAYANTPASDSKLRAHYLALIIRSRSTFKRSGTMQMEMEAGGSPLFFDLFVAMVNHLDDIASSARSPRS